MNVDEDGNVNKSTKIELLNKARVKNLLDIALLQELMEWLEQWVRAAIYLALNPTWLSVVGHAAKASSVI